MMEAEQRREWIKSRRKKRNHARHARLRRQFLRYSMLLLLLAGGAAGFTKLPWCISSTDCEIVVKSNKVVSDEQVKHSLKSVLFAPIYTLDPRQLEHQVSELKAVKRAFVRRYALPKPRIVVEVQEEVPWATFALGPESPPTAVISQTGKLIPIKEFPNIEQPPLKIFGLATIKLTPETVGQWASWIAFISQQTKEPVDFVDMRKPFDVRVQNGTLNLKLGTPDMSLTRRLGRLTSILSAVEPLKDRLQYIDLGLDNNIPLKVTKEDPSKARRDALNARQQAQQASTPVAVQESQPVTAELSSPPLKQVVQQPLQRVQATAGQDTAGSTQLAPQNVATSPASPM